MSSLLAPELLAPIAVDRVFVHEPGADHSAAAHAAAARPEPNGGFTWNTRPGRCARGAVIAFPIVVTIVDRRRWCPQSAPLIATLMLGNLLKESRRRAERSRSTAANEITNISTLFLGLVIGSLMQAATFLRMQTLAILLLGLGAFVLDTVAGLLFGKLLARDDARQDQSAGRRRGDQRVSDERAPGAEIRAGRGLHQSRADARDGRQHRRTAGSVIAGGILLALVTSLLAHTKTSGSPCRRPLNE